MLYYNKIWRSFALLLFCVLMLFISDRIVGIKTLLALLTGL